MFAKLLWVALPLLTPGDDDAPDAGARALPAPALAVQIDRALALYHRQRQLRPSDRCDDATFLRRLSLDLRGAIPEREEVRAFLSDRSPDKRARLVDAFLDDPATAGHLATVWGDALLSGAQPSRFSAPLRPWLAEAFADQRPFAELTHELISARGASDENGAVAFVAAYRDQKEALAAVTARTFLGLQIQCAQCHDHPYDDWSQQQFQQFAAYYAASRARPLDRENSRYELSDADLDRDRRTRRNRLREALRRARENGREVAAGAFAERRFLDGTQGEGPGSAREQLADWLVDEDNPWFARAVVNRSWSQMFGHGLLEPVDDLSGSTDRVLPQLLDVLAIQFQRSGTDLRHLLRAFALTETYQRGPALDNDPMQREELERHFAGHPIRPLRTEQILNALAQVTEVRPALRRRAGSRPLTMDAGDASMANPAALRRFKYVFPDDEGGEADSFEAGIPQALFLMNSRMTNDAISLRASTVLGEILAESDNDKERLHQMFYATLGRPPSAKESSALFRMMRSGARGKGQGMTDVYWALINSSEFLTNR